MAYEVYLGTMLCPVPPSKIDTKIKGQNKTLTLINDGEINMLKAPGLTEISFDLLLPNVKYPFARLAQLDGNDEDTFGAGYKVVWKNAKWYLDRLEMLKQRKKVFPFIVSRRFPNGIPIFDNDIKVSLEDYTIKEDKKEGFDFVVTVKLKQYKEYGTKIYNGTGTLQPTRSTENSPEAKTHPVKPGDTLWNIAKYYYDDGSKYTAIYNANKSIIGGNPNLIYPGQVLTIPDPTQNITTSAGAETPTNVFTTRRKVTLGVKWGGEPGAYGFVVVYYTKDGKSVREEHINSFQISVDKGTEVRICPRENYCGDGKWKYEFGTERRVTWSDIGKYGVEGERAVKATLNVNVVISIIWKSERFG